MATQLFAATTTTIYLSGSLAHKFFRRKVYQLDSGEGWEAIKALRATVTGWSEEIARLERLGMRFAIFRNRINVGQEGLRVAGSREIRIVPVIGGSKRAGALQTVVGVVLMIGSFWAGPYGPAVFNAGLALTTGGVIQMLSPQASGLRQSASPDNLPNYAFGSARNTTASGNSVPICIGERRWGGAIISASIFAEDKA